MRTCILPRLRSTRWASAYPSLGTAASRRQSTAPSASSTSKPRVDPFELTAPILASLRKSILPILTSGDPALSELTSYYPRHPSKHIRPLIIILISLATNGLGKRWETKFWQSQTRGAGGREEELDWPLTRTDVLNDWNPDMPENVTGRWEDGFTIGQPVHKQLRPNSSLVQASSPSTSSSPSLFTPPYILPSQLRLAQIVELVHAASLLHDDVIDESPLRRGAPSAPAAFGNKLSVLGGNFVLGRASAALSRLGDPEVTELIASVISNLVEGEILQMRDVIVGGGNGQGESGLAATALSSAEQQKTSTIDPGMSVPSDKIRDAWNIYLQKTYLKTASLMAKGARAAVALGGCAEGEIYREVAYAYGRNLGIAFQLVDDVLDYASPSDTLGKPGGADLQLGLATGPALYAWEEHPELGELIARKFEGYGDVEKARALVHASLGVERTRKLAQAYANKAKEVLLHLPESEAREGLEVLADKMIGRKA